ncbi:MAG: hypothetical protein CMJ76_14210 [Planctomycetaceae bacterium]|nr:hypothetical protein [Planctomycetaceae bacterium]
MNAEQPVATTKEQKRVEQVGWLAVVLIIFISIYAAFVQRPAVATDVGTYLLANATNDARNPTILTSVDPRNLSQNRNSPITWWPESYGAIPEIVEQLAAIIGNHLDIGQVIQWTTFIGWILGITLWFLFFRLVCPATALPWIFLCFLTARYSHVNFYLYDGGEFFYWALFPAVLLLNCKAVLTDQSKLSSTYLAAGAGTVTPLLVLIKYSAGLSSVGFGAGWLWLIYSGYVSKRSFLSWCVNAGMIAGFIFWLGLIPEGNPTQIDSPIQWTPLLWIPGAWLFAMTDLGTLFNKFTLDILPAMGSHEDGSEGWLFIPFALLLWWVLKNHFSQRAKDKSAELKIKRTKPLLIGHLLGFSLMLLVFLVRGSAIHMDTRFLRPAAIALLPLILMALWSAGKSSRLQIRISAQLLLVSFALIPSLYGIASLGDKTFIRSRYADALTDSNGLRHDLLSKTGDGAAFFEMLEKMTTAKDVIYIIEPTMGIPLKKRRLFIEEHAHLRSRTSLASRNYRGTPAGNLFIPLPKQMVNQGKADAIKRSFQDISNWKVSVMQSQPDWILLIGN